MAECIGKSGFNIVGIYIPEQLQIVIRAGDRTIDRIGRIIYKNRIGSVILPFQLFCHAGRSTIPPFQRMVNKQKAEQNNSKTEAITVFVGIILPGYNFRCHPTLLSHNAEVCTERTDIIIVTDQDIAGIRLDEEITIIYVLIAVTVIVQFSKSIDDLDGSVANGGKTLETNLLLFSASQCS